MAGATLHLDPWIGGQANKAAGRKCYELISPVDGTIAAEIVAASVSDEALAAGTLFPRLTELREITSRIACAVVREANSLGVGGDIPDAEIEERVSNTMWDPQYPSIEAV